MTDHSPDHAERAAIAQIIARAYGGSLRPGLGVDGDYPTDDVDYLAADAIIALRGRDALVEAVDAWIADPTPEAEQAIMDVRAALNTGDRP